VEKVIKTTNHERERIIKYRTSEEKNKEEKYNEANK
jgi:hypothetical protein